MNSTWHGFIIRYMDTSIKKTVFNVKAKEFKQITLAMPEIMHSALSILADLQGETIPWVIRQALEAYLNEVVKKYPEDFKKLKIPK